MSKVLKVLSLSFLLCLSLVVAPFHISANASLSAPFVGYNIYYYDYDTDTYITTYNVDLDDTNFKMSCTNMVNNGCMTYQQTSNGDVTGTISLKGSTGVHNNTILKIELILDDNYVGYVNLTHSGTSKNYYVNGNKIEIYTTDTGQTITVNSYDLSLNNSEKWEFPIESFNIINQQFQNNYQVLNYIGNGQYIFPVFNVPSGSTMGQIWTGGPNAKIIFIFGVDRNLQMSNYTNSLSFENCTVDSIQEMYFSNTLTVKKFTLTSTNTSGGFVSVKAKYNAKYMPIYFNTQGQQQFASTDFAINFGLKNDLMQAIYNIANGTSSTASSQSNLAQSTDDLTQSSNQLVTQEDTFNNDMNSALQNVNTDFNFGSNFGSKFIASADWVKTQYDRLTGNTPFGSVISFSLLIGLALLLVGKVFK